MCSYCTFKLEEIGRHDRDSARISAALTAEQMNEFSEVFGTYVERDGDRGTGGALDQSYRDFFYILLYPKRVKGPVFPPY